MEEEVNITAIVCIAIESAHIPSTAKAPILRQSFGRLAILDMKRKSIYVCNNICVCKVNVCESRESTHETKVNDPVHLTFIVYLLLKTFY